jgi:hypothetical protein
MAMMDNVSRPLIAVLAATVALFGLYYVALRGSSKSATSSGTSSQSLGQYQSDIAAAHHAVAIAGASDAASGGGSVGATSAPTNGAATRAANTASRATGGASRGTSAIATKPAHRTAIVRRLNVVAQALANKKVLRCCSITRRRPTTGPSSKNLLRSPRTTTK